jgi:hypothetical protein
MTVSDFTPGYDELMNHLRKLGQKIGPRSNKTFRGYRRNVGRLAYRRAKNSVDNDE